MSDELYSMLYYKICNLAYVNELDLSSLRIPSIDMVLQMGKFQEKIRRLTMQSNDIKSIAGIRSCNNLVYMDVSYNRITSLHSLPLLIEELLIRDNSLKAIRLRRCYEKLYYLDISNNDVTDLSFIKFFPNLKHLNINNNPIKDMSPILKLKSLAYLEVNGKKHNKECLSIMKQKAQYMHNLEFLTTSG